MTEAQIQRLRPGEQVFDPGTRCVWTVRGTPYLSCRAGSWAARLSRPQGLAGTEVLTLVPERYRGLVPLDQLVLRRDMTIDETL